MPKRFASAHPEIRAENPENGLPESRAALELLLEQLKDSFEEFSNQVVVLQEENNALRHRLGQQAQEYFAAQHDDFRVNACHGELADSGTNSKTGFFSLVPQPGSPRDSDANDAPIRQASVSSVVSPAKIGKLKRSLTSSSLASYRLDPVWEQLDRPGAFSELASSMHTAHALPESLMGTPVEIYMGTCKDMISSPGSTSRNMWDLLGVFFIIYDLIIVPLRAFGLPEPGVISGIDWVNLLYWTINVPASMTVGYIDNGLTIMNPRKIILNYLKTWFALDLAVLVPDWYFNVVAESISDNPQSAWKVIRMLRLSKCLRLLRAARLKKITQALNDQIASEHTGIVINIVKMIFCLLLVNEYIASFWYLIGTKLSTTNRWAHQYFRAEASWFEKFCVSFHWSITQFTPASKVDIQPQNLVERCYAILVVIFALVGFSYMFGSITASLSQLRAIAEDAEKQFWQVRRYLRQNSVSPSLSTRIQRFLEHAYAKSKTRAEAGNIRVFTLLSDSLRSELQLEIALPQLQAHPLFVQLSIRVMPTLRRIATTCITYQNLASGDVLFFPGESATHTYFLCAGLLQYTGMASSEDEGPEWVEGKEDWLAEPILWTPYWVHVGTPVATMESEILKVLPATFSEMVRFNPAAFEIVSSYAQLFLGWLKDQNTVSDIYKGDQVFAEFAEFCQMDATEIQRAAPSHPTRRFRLLR